MQAKVFKSTDTYNVAEHTATNRYVIVYYHAINAVSVYTPVGSSIMERYKVMQYFRQRMGWRCTKLGHNACYFNFELPHNGSTSRG